MKILGWMEGTIQKCYGHLYGLSFFKESANINKTVKRMKHEYGDERAMNKIQGMKRTHRRLLLLLWHHLQWL